MSFDPGTRIGAYQLVQSCGSGAYGEVFVAENLLTGERLALKVLFPSPKTLERELAGLIRCRDCRHPNLTRIWHVERIPDAFYYTMDLADDLNAGRGEYVPATLANRLERHKRLSPEEVEELADAIGGALKALHAKGLIHRDVKPDNILWINGVPTLGDAGLTASERACSLVGTPEFMPEAVLRKKRAAVPADDFYALRLVLYCAFTGEAPGAYPHCPPGLLTGRTAALWKRILASGETPEPPVPARRGSRVRYFAAVATVLLLLAAAVFVSLSRRPAARPAKTVSRSAAPENAAELFRRFQADEAEYEKFAAAAKRHRRIFYANLTMERNKLLFQKEFAHLSAAEYLAECGELRRRAAAGKERDVLLRLYECQDALTGSTDRGALKDLPPLLTQRHELLARLADHPEVAEVYGLITPDWDFFDALSAEAPEYHWGEAMKNPKIREFCAQADRFSGFFKRLPGEDLGELKALLADRTVGLSDREKLLTAVCAMQAGYIDQPDWEGRNLRCDESNIRLYAERFRQNKYLFECLYREYPQYRP